jgi:HEAT repeat protein
MLLLGAVAGLPTAALSAPSKGSVAVSTAAPAALGREAIAVLSALGGDSDAEVRASVAAEWGNLGNRAAIARLKKTLSDDRADVRIAAAASLIALGDVQGLVALIDETKPISSGAAASPADELRRMARDAARARAVLKLGEAAKGSALETLRTALGDEAGEVRDAAAVALARLGLGDSAQFLAAAADPDEGVRSAGAKALGLIGREGLRELSRLAASDASANVRAEAALALANFRDPKALEVLVAALADKNTRVRLNAARALARQSASASTAALKKLLDQAPPAELALVASAALARRGQDPDLELAEMTLGQRDPDLKALAVAALAASSRPRAREILSNAMRSDPDARVRAAAAAAIVAQLRKVGDSR